MKGKGWKSQFEKTWERDIPHFNDEKPYYRGDPIESPKINIYPLTGIKLSRDFENKTLFGDHCSNKTVNFSEHLDYRYSHPMTHSTGNKQLFVYQRPDIIQSEEGIKSTDYYQRMFLNRKI